MRTRRQFCGALAAAGLLAGRNPARSDVPVTVTDMAGRRIELTTAPKRIILLEAHDMLTMALLHPDPSSLVVGWAATDRIDSDVLAKRLLGGRPIQIVGKMAADTVSLEGIAALQPDLVVTSAFMVPPDASDSLVSRLASLSIPVLFSDVSSNRISPQEPSDPVTAFRASMRMWGAILGMQSKAEAYIALVEKELAAISAVLAGSTPVTTYLEVQSTTDDCCWAAGRKIWGELLSLAGGQPLPGVVAPWFEKLSLEYLLSTPHDVYIAAGGGWAAGGRPTLGPGIGPDDARASLARLVEARPSFEHLASVQNRRVHAIWTGLITNLPLNILFIAQAARWLHPDRFEDKTPEALLRTINRDFCAVPLDGPLWTSL